MSGRAKVQIRRYGRSFLILVGLIVVGTAAGFYILLQQRLPNPFQSFYTVNAAFPTAAAVVPGLGEPVNVAGVRVGEITNSELLDGHGVIQMDIDPSKMPRLYRNATANLVPNTPLKDMEIDIAPGSPSAGVLPHGGTIPVAQTTSPTDSDELLDALDTDTRTWFTSLITDLNQGTQGRGSDIRKLLSNLGPTAQQLRQIGDLLAGRRSALSQIVHNLGVLTQAAAVKDSQLRQVVQAGNTTVQALATQNVALRSAITKLPGTLATTDKTLTDLIPLSDALGPTATALLPTARKLPTTLRDTRTLFQGAALLPIEGDPALHQGRAAARLAASRVDLHPHPSGAGTDQIVQGARLRDQRDRLRPRGSEPGIPVLARMVRAQRRLVHLAVGRQRSGMAGAGPGVVLELANLPCWAAAADAAPDQSRVLTADGHPSS